MSSSHANQQQTRKKGGNEPWRSKDRHYCAICNVWMGHDKQSIALHENGKKHREAVEADLVRRRDGKVRKEKEQKELESVFAKISAAVGVTAGGGSSSVSNFPPVPQQIASSLQQLPSIKKEGASHDTNNTEYAADNVASSSISAAIPSSEVLTNSKKKPVFDPNVGHYNIDGTIYLEGQVYAPILQEGMPIQLWMGSIFATNTEKCDLRNMNQWKMALLVKVVRTRRGREEGVRDGEEEGDCDSNTNNNNSKVSCHVSYLKTPTDDDETIETNVEPSRIRLILGSDSTLPSSLEEAHLLLLGGKQVIKLNTNSEDTTTTANIDENTGLSSWTTTEITKVTVQYEMNQEKKRKRQHEKELADYQTKKEYELQARKMEEAKYDNAHDSALGAYDVWSNPEDIRTYKGVDITTSQPAGETSVVPQSVSKGMGNVPFKKMGIRKKKHNGRTTSADDD